LHDKTGTYHRERRFVPGATAEEARRNAKARENHLYNHGDTPPPKEAPTLKEFGERWIREYAIANGQKPSSIAAKQSILQLHLYPVLGGMALDAIGEPEVQRLKLHLGSLSDKTKACVLSVLSGLLRVAARWRIIPAAPHIERIKVATEEMHFYDFAAYEQLLDGARRAGSMVLCAILLGGDAGLRRGECVALEQADVGRDHLTVSRNDWRGQVGSPKGNKSRRIPLTSRLAEAIAAVKHLRGPRLLYFNDHPATALDLNRAMEKACARAGLPRSQAFHVLRHTFCSHLAMRGAPPTVIQALAGHASLRETQRYLHLAKGSAEAAIALLEGPAGLRREQG
jgi:integrase